MAEDAATLRDALEALMEALRVFVVQTTAMVSKKDPKRTELAEQLLKPIMAWETPGGRGKGTEPPGDEAPAVPPAVPPSPAVQPSPQ
jgi:hypothetical protein